MQRIAAVLILTLVAISLLVVTLLAHRQEAELAVTVYDPNPTHIWNRLHSALFVRDDIPATRFFPDPLDAPYWDRTSYLLDQPSHHRMLRILDEFLQTHAENAIRDPLKRAMLQRDLWAAFDWSVMRQPKTYRDPAYEKEKRELQTRLAEILRRLALSPEEIESLPNNYEKAVASGEFAKEYDPVHCERAFLPPDLFGPHGPWVEIEGLGDPQPVAVQHFGQFSGRSRFRIFVRLPAGRKATFDYLETVWNFPKPTIPSPHYAPGQDVAPNPDLPQFPAGTQFALVRQMVLFDNQGRLVSTPITESLQIRVYRTLARSSAPPINQDQVIAQSGQDFYEIRLRRPRLFANQAGGLQATEPNEKEFTVFGFIGPGNGDPGSYAATRPFAPLKSCVQCHGAPGINSVNSRSVLLKPHLLQRDVTADFSGPRTWEDARIVPWKKRQADWELLNQLWTHLPAK